MSWLIRIDPMPRERFKHWLNEQEITEQIRSDSARAQEIQLAQLTNVKARANLMSDWIHGPKISGKIEGHANESGDALPQGAQNDHITIDLYQVRCAGDSASE